MNNKHLIFIRLLIAIFFLTGIACQKLIADEFDSAIKLQKGTKIVFIDVNEARKLLATKDEFIQSLAPFDRSIRLKTEKPVLQEEFLNFVSKQALEWTGSEIVRMEDVIKSVTNKLKPFDLKLPRTILMIKTTGAEEGNAAYCRRNAIVLPKSMLALRSVSFRQGMAFMQKNNSMNLEHIVIHELFHIYMIHNPELKEKFYGIINFKKCNTIELPRKLREVEITAPEIPKNEYYIELQYKGDIINTMPVILFPRDDLEKGNDFSRCLDESKLLVIEKSGDRWIYKHEDNNEPILLNFNDVPDYYKKTGANTDYVIHPEEILAENFVLLVQGNQSVQSKWVLEEMDELFQRVSQ
jgi:hypothetical protein